MKINNNIFTGNGATAIRFPPAGSFNEIDVNLIELKVQNNLIRQGQGFDEGNIVYSTDIPVCTFRIFQSPIGGGVIPISILRPKIHLRSIEAGALGLEASSLTTVQNSDWIWPDSVVDQRRTIHRFRSADKILGRASVIHLSNGLSQKITTEIERHGFGIRRKDSRYHGSQWWNWQRDRSNVCGRAC